jgi:ABC-type polysaccharide/polyol phosphate export permease
MKNSRQSLTKTNLWEHLVPFVLLLISANTYLAIKSSVIQAMLLTSGIDSFNAISLIIIAFLLVNVCCFLGYALSQLCLYTLKMLFTSRQNNEPLGAISEQLTSSFL